MTTRHLTRKQPTRHLEDAVKHSCSSNNAFIVIAGVLQSQSHLAGPGFSRCGSGLEVRLGRQ